jgi:hypothetical protein
MGGEPRSSVLRIIPSALREVVVRGCVVTHGMTLGKSNVILYLRDGEALAQLWLDIDAARSSPARTANATAKLRRNGVPERRIVLPFDRDKVRRYLELVGRKSSAERRMHRSALTLASGPEQQHGQVLAQLMDTSPISITCVEGVVTVVRS